MNLEKRGRMWCVVMKSGALPYSSSCYAKAVGVVEFIEQGGFTGAAFRQASGADEPNVQTVETASEPLAPLPEHD